MLYWPTKEKYWTNNGLCLKRWKKSRPNSTFFLAVSNSYQCKAHRSSLRVIWMVSSPRLGPFLRRPSQCIRWTWMLVLQMLTDLYLAVDPAEQMSTATSVQTGHVVRNALFALRDSFWWLSVPFMLTGFARYVFCSIAVAICCHWGLCEFKSCKRLHLLSKSNYRVNILSNTYQITTKIVQQDRDECLEIPNLCKERNQCLNTPGKLATRLPDLVKGDIRADQM